MISNAFIKLLSSLILGYTKSRKLLTLLPVSVFIVVWFYQSSLISFISPDQRPILQILTPHNKSRSKNSNYNTIILKDVKQDFINIPRY